MFGFFKRVQQQRAEAREARDSVTRQRAYEAQQQRLRAQERETQIAATRVITGELKHRYVLVDALRGFGVYIVDPGHDYDPTEVTRRATYDLQRQAVALGANAVIHARFEILRYSEDRQGRPLPIYEAHAFGTAVRIVGPPSDWPENTEWDYNLGL